MSEARKSITIMTSSWGDMTPGPIALHLPQGLVAESSVREFNCTYRGRALALYSEGNSHFMTGQTFNELLAELYPDAFRMQRARHKLDGSVRGMILADAWLGYHATSSGEDLARQAFTQQHNVEMPQRQPGVLKEIIELSTSCISSNAGLLLFVSLKRGFSQLSPRTKTIKHIQ